MDIDALDASVSIDSSDSCVTGLFKGNDLMTTGHVKKSDGFFYIGKSNMNLRYERRTQDGRLIDYGDVPEYKFGISSNLDKRLSNYRNKLPNFEILYSWQVHRTKDLEKFVKIGVKDSMGREFYHPFSWLAKYSKAYIHTNSTWGMSEWLMLDEDSCLRFARDVDFFIASRFFSLRDTYGKGYDTFTHYWHGKTNLYFDDSKRNVDEILYHIGSNTTIKPQKVTQ